MGILLEFFFKIAEENDFETLFLKMASMGGRFSLIMMLKREHERRRRKLSGAEVAPASSPPCTVASVTEWLPRRLSLHGMLGVPAGSQESGPVRDVS